MQIDPVLEGKTRILLVDDHPVVREGIRNRLEAEPDFAVVGEVGDSSRVIDATRELHPDVVVLDYVMPKANGMQVAQKMSQVVPDTRIIMYSMYSDEAYVARALTYGVRGYVAKRSVTDELVKAIHSVMQGERYLSPPHSNESIEEYMRAGSKELALWQTLTPREREVAGLIVEGLSSREIADKLGISERTVETHRSHIRKKLGARSMAEMVRRYTRGLDETGEV
jgi:DNA-binding NarL/FixJ family response regulator